MRLRVPHRPPNSVRVIEVFIRLGRIAADQAQPFTSDVIRIIQGPKAPRILQPVRHEVERPLFGRLRARRRAGMLVDIASAFALASLNQRKIYSPG